MFEAKEEDLDYLELRLSAEPKLRRQLLKMAYNDYCSVCFDAGCYSIANWQEFITAIEEQE